MKTLICMTILTLAGCGSDGSTRHFVVSPAEAESLDSGAWTITRQPGSTPTTGETDPRVEDR